MARVHTKAFTFLELLVGLAILVILAGIIIPKVASLREGERRIRCADNLRTIGQALSQYGASNRDELPRVIYDQTNQPRSFTAFTGPDAASPFLPNGGVEANDVTAALWLLVRDGYIKPMYSPPSAVFVCPSSSDTPDPISDAGGNLVAPNQRSNFRAPRHLSYSYASPFGDAKGYGLKSDFLEPGFVIMADRNPGKVGPNQDVTGPMPEASGISVRAANSRNHGQAGQYVLYGDMHADFTTTPYCGVGGDNIYTAQAAQPVISGEEPPAKVRGYLGKDIGPAWATDSYLVPAEGY